MVLFDLNRLCQLTTIINFKRFFASTMTSDKQEKIIINLAGDVMIG